MEPITADHVSRVQERAYAADEKADAAGLLVAESLVTGVGDIGSLITEYRVARADAHYAWCVYSDALDQRGQAVPA